MQKRLIGIDAAIAQKRPVAAGVFALGGITLDNQNLLFVVGSFGNDSSKWICDERVSPKFQTRVTVGGLAFEADAVDDGDVNTIGDGVSTLNRAPGVELSSAEFRFFVRVPADAGGIKDHLRTTKRGNARTFRIPLVPTNLHANFSVPSIKVREAKVTWSEIEFFVVEGIVGDMHLAVFAEEAAVGIKHRTSVVVYAGGAALKERCDQHNFAFSCDLRECGGRGARNRFGEIKELGVFSAAKIFAAEKLVQTDDLRVARRCFADFADSTGEIFFRLTGATHLHEAYSKFVCHNFLV